MLPFRRREWRLVRDDDGRVVGVRPAGDPWFSLDFMRDHEVIRFFREQDEHRGRVRLPEFEPLLPDDDGEALRGARHARGVARAARRRSR